MPGEIVVHQAKAIHNYCDDIACSCQGSGPNYGSVLPWPGALSSSFELCWFIANSLQPSFSFFFLFRRARPTELTTNIENAPSCQRSLLPSSGQSSDDRREYCATSSCDDGVLCGCASVARPSTPDKPDKTARDRHAPRHTYSLAATTTRDN